MSNTFDADGVVKTHFCIARYSRYAPLRFIHARRPVKSITAIPPRRNRFLYAVTMSRFSYEPPTRRNPDARCVAAELQQLHRRRTQFEREREREMGGGGSLSTLVVDAFIVIESRETKNCKLFQ